MITIDQLLEFVDLDFEPRFVTKNYCGEITIFDSRPYIGCEEWCGDDAESRCFGPINLSEFADKPWSECIYEVPRKTTGKIYKFDSSAIDTLYDRNPEKFKKFICGEIVCKLNEVIDAVNELKGAKNE